MLLVSFVFGLFIYIFFYNTYFELSLQYSLGNYLIVGIVTATTPILHSRLSKKKAKTADTTINQFKMNREKIDFTIIRHNTRFVLPVLPFISSFLLYLIQLFFSWIPNDHTIISHRDCLTPFAQINSINFYLVYQKNNRNIFTTQFKEDDIETSTQCGDKINTQVIDRSP